MKCPNCGAEHPDDGGRFCDACGMSVIKYAAPSSAASDEESKKGKVRCRTCGIDVVPPTCPMCGRKLPLPDDMDEAD